MASQIINVELQNLTRVERDVYYMRTSAGNMRIHGNRIIANTVNKSKKIFRDGIQQYVYAISPTTYDRTGNVGRGVKSRNFNKGLAAGEIYLDKGIVGDNGYFYPDSVEHGLSSKPAYYGRHYWARSKELALNQFQRDFAEYGMQMAAKLLGK